MANTIKILFWLHRAKANKAGLVPLMLRISLSNKRAEKATGYYIDPISWNGDKQRLKGNKELNQQINVWMDEIVAKVNHLYRREKEDNVIHLPSILNAVFIKGKDEPSLLTLINEHNEKMKEKVGNGYTHSTYEKYVFTFNKVQDFINRELKAKDVLLKDITTKFIMDFDHYLRVIEGNQHNTAVKYCINLKRVLNVAVMEGTMVTNPLNRYKTGYKDTPQIYLSQKEVDAIQIVELKKPSHLLVRDLFLFQCNTGLAYSDMVALTSNDISDEVDGRKWIIKKRQKTGVVSTIPLLATAITLIEKYSDSGAVKGALFPSYSIQKYNQYLNEVAVMAGVTKRVSSHVGRRTFGNIALGKGISLNVISKILGHSNTLITQRIYAITTQNIIITELEKW